MQCSSVLHRYEMVYAVKIINNTDQGINKQQINAVAPASPAFICGIDYQCFALTNSYAFLFLLIIYTGFYYTTGKKNTGNNKITTPNKIYVMKKISTLGFGILISIASFASFAPSRLTVSAEGNANIKVTVDGNRFDQQSFNNSVVFDNLQPGFHSVKVYQLTEKRAGFFGRRQAAEYRLVYNASVNIRPLFATTIELNRFGSAQVNEQPLRGGYKSRDWDNDNHGYNGNDGYKNNDRDYNSKQYGNDYGSYNGYNNNGIYGRTISNEDFFAAERVMERESFDDARLLYAKRLVDDNYLCAEQVKELARFFSFDNNRLDFARYAYSRTTDKNNFSVVCNAFSSGNSRDQLMSFIKSCR